MKDQRRLLNVCLVNKIPAFILQGRDICSIEILQSALDIYGSKGCSDEFLFDFQELKRDFSEYQNENPSEIQPTLSTLSIGESDKKKLLVECLENDIPVIVFQGTDACSLDILKSANEIYKNYGYSEEFQYDFQNLINGFSGYQYENQLTIKLPALSEIEKELIQKSMHQKMLDTSFISAVESNDFEKIAQLKEQHYHPSEKVLQALDIPDNTMIAVHKIFNMKFLDDMKTDMIVSKNSVQHEFQAGMIR